MFTWWRCCWLCWCLHPTPLDKHLARGHHSDLAPVLFGGEAAPEQKTRRSISLPCGNRKEIITAAHLVLVGLSCESGGGPLGHQVRIALHEIYVYINQRTHLANCVHNRKKLLIASNDRDRAAANRLHRTESDLYRGRL